MKEFAICHEIEFTVWSDLNHRFGNCFYLGLFGYVPALLFAISSAYFLAKPTPFIRLPTFPWQIWLKMTSQFLLVSLLSVHLISFYLPFASLYHPPYPALLACLIIVACAELIHLVFLYNFMVPFKLFFRRGPSWIIMTWLLTVPFYAISLHQKLTEEGANESSARLQLDTGLWISCIVIKAFYFIAHCVPNKPDFSQLPFRYQRAIRRQGARISDDEDDDETERADDEIDAFNDRSLLLGESLTASYRARPRPRNVSPETASSLWSWITFSWPYRLLHKGVRSPATSPEHAMKLPKDLKVVSIINEFDVSDFVRPIPLYTGHHSTTTLDQTGLESMKSLGRRILSIYGYRILIFGLFEFIQTAANFAMPLLLSALLHYMEGTAKDIHVGLTWAGLMIGVSLINGLISVHLDYQKNRLALSIRSALISAVYQKATLVSHATFAGKSIGEILNMMSTDCERVSGTIRSIHQLWSVPLSCVATLVILYYQIGYVFAVGLGFSIFMIAVNQCIGNYINKINKRFMTAKDARIRLITDIIYSMKQIKMQAWETIFSKRITELRQKELKELKSIKYLDAACVYFWATTPVLLSVMLIGIYAYMGQELTAARIFTALTLINMLIFPLNAYPWVINGTIEGWVSLKRLQSLMDTAVIDYQIVYQKFDVDDKNSEDDMYGLNSTMEPAMKIENCNFGYNSAESSMPVRILSRVNLKIGYGDFIGIVGPVGAGKTSLLLGMLGELERPGDGAVYWDAAHAGVSIVTQEPWIFGGTVRENILFGSPYNAEWYRRVIDACCLLTDIEQWPGGDLTEVGEGGSTLSGGQKSRINLARQVYQQKDIYLLDDIFSQLDAPVCMHIYENVIMGLLRDTTRILVSHQIDYLRDARLACLIENGTIQSIGTTKEILGKEFTSPTLSPTNDADADVECILKETEPPAKERSHSLEQSEEKIAGTVSLEIYGYYIKMTGFILSFIILLSLVIMQGSKTLTDWYLVYWIHQDKENSTNAPFYAFHADLYATDNWSPRDIGLSYLQMFILLGCFNSFMTLVRSVSFAKGGLVAAFNLHSRLLSSVLNVQPSWFDQNPPGRTINRFSSDINESDDSLPFILNIFLNDFVRLLGTIAIIAYSLPWFLLVIIPLIPFYTRLQYYYRDSARDLKRIAGISLSPIYQHFSESITGGVTIRALRKSHHQNVKNHRLLEANQRVRFSMMAINAWLSFRLTVGIGVTVMAVTTLIAVIEHEYAHADPALIGLALSYAIPLTSIISSFMQDFLSTELGFVSVERIKQYSTLRSEKSNKPLPTPPAAWPAQPKVEFTRVTLQYPNTQEPALKDISFTIGPRQHIAIVGRTGSGKSSIFSCLLRLVENIQGEIRLDGIDISGVDVTTVRSVIGIISQDSLLFSGTVRQNLDPGGEYADHSLYKVIDTVELNDKISSIGGLDGTVDARGNNFSQGEKQLFCLGRALLNKSKILLIDEATSSVDIDTEKKIHDIIKTNLCDATLIGKV